MTTKELINPCINCITYPMCKSQYMECYNHMTDLNESKNTIDIIMCEEPVLIAYIDTLLTKCHIIQEYLKQTTKPYKRDSASRILYQETIESQKQVLIDTFINPKF